MKVLVTFAVDTEFAPWRRLRDFRRASLEGNNIYEAQIGDAELRVVLTGIGPGPAGRAARTALSDRPDFCISSGLAGGLKPAYEVSEILGARAICFSGSDGILRSDKSLFDCAIRCGAKPVEMFCTSERLARTAEEKYALSLEADAVEMESYAVLAEAARWGVPGVAIRAISDVAGDDLPYDFDRASDPGGRIRLPGVLAEIARRPHRLPALLRLSRQCRQAAALLTQFLDLFIGAWQAGMSESELLDEVGAT